MYGCLPRVTENDEDRVNTEQGLSVLHHHRARWHKIHSEINPAARLVRVDALARSEAYEDCITILTALPEQVLSTLRLRSQEWRRIHAEIVPAARLARIDALARIEAYEDCINSLTTLPERTERVKARL